MQINSQLSDPIFHADSYWHLPTSYIEEVSEQLLKQQKQKANVANYSAATSSALLSCIIAGLGGGKSEFDPSKFLPCTDQADLEEDEKEANRLLDLDNQTIEVIINQLESRQLPPWVYALLGSNFSRWREQIS